MQEVCTYKQLETDCDLTEFGVLEAIKLLNEMACNPSDKRLTIIASPENAFTAGKIVATVAKDYEVGFIAFPSAGDAWLVSNAFNAVGSPGA